MKTMLHETNERGRQDEPLLAATQTHGVIRKDEYEHRTVEALTNLESLKFVEVDDFVISLRSFEGGIERASATGIISPAYTVLRAVSPATPEYLAWLLKSRAFIDGLRVYVTGIREGQNIDYSKLGRSGLPLPPVYDQTAIVRFLGHFDSRIQRFIAAKKRLIQLLGEEKRVILRHAVTRGLNSDVPVKPSGIEWLGDVPEHWELTRIKSEFTCLNHRRRPLNSTDRGLRKGPYPYYGASGVIDHVDEYLFDESLLLVAEDGANLVLRNLPLAIRADGQFWVNNHAHILKPVNGHLPYLQALLEAIDYRPYISGAAQPKLTKDRFLGIGVAVPPIGEQVSTMQRLEELLAPQNAAEKKAQQHIDRLREYRIRLVSDVVTGKLDVREAARDLPDDPDTEASALEEHLDRAVA